MDLRLVAWSVLLAAGLAACVPGTGEGPPDGGEDVHPQQARWPSQQLPWKLSVDPVTGGLVSRDISFDVSFDGNSARWQQGMLAAVAALPDRVAVVFPPADGEGFEIAHASLDEGWQRVALSQIPPREVGTVASTHGPDGRLYVVLRRKGGAQDLTLYTWQPGEPVTSEPIPRLGESTSFSFHDRCDDVSLAVAADGTLHVVFQQVAGAQGDNWVVRASRAPGQAWRHEQVVAGGDYPAPSDDRELNEVGCRSVLALDESDQPVVMTLFRRVWRQSLQADMSSQPLGRAWPLMFWRDGKGIWREQGYGAVRLPNLRTRDAAPRLTPWDVTTRSYTPQFDLAAHPQGFLVATDFVNSANVRLRLQAASLVRDDWGTWDPPELDFNAVGEQTAQVAGALAFEPCGGVLMVQSLTDSASTRLQPLMGGYSRCGFSAARAPVFGRWSFDAFSYVTVARGRRVPYPAVLCGATDGTLAICAGGHDGQGSEGEAPALVSSNVEDEARVGTDFTWEFVLSRPPADGEQLSANVVDTLARKTVPVSITPGAAPGGFKIQPQGLQEGTRYRLEATYARPETLGVASWQFAGLRVPGVTVEVGPAPAPDPRWTLLRWPCEAFPETYRRAADGTCEYIHEADPRPSNSVPIVLPWDGWYGADRWQQPEAPWLEDAQGARVSFATPARFMGAPRDRYEKMVWSELLEEYAEYTVRYPASARSEVGGPLHADDLRLRFRTRAQPLYVKQTSPAHLATGVAPDAPIDITFNTRAVIPSDGVRMEALPAGTLVPLSMVQLEETVWRFLHAPLEPGTDYRVTLSNRLTDEFNAPLQHAPVTFVFTVAP